MSTYLPPILSAAGLTIPGYQAILQDNLAQYQKIYGANQYVGVDSAIYQLISVISLKQADTMAALQYAYNQTSPATAVGAGLDRIVKLNGIARLPYTYSIANLLITGTPGAVLTNASAQDTNGNIWLLPSPTTIGGGGTVNATGTCTTAGAVTAEPGAINIVATPQPGWTSVTNAVAALPGTPIESDSQLRARQAISVSIPSHTMLAGVIAAVAAVPGVTRYNIVENYTNVVDALGNPPHSITAVVEGATNNAVAQAIYNQRGLGVYTNGTTTVAITDPNTLTVTNINFYRPAYIPIFVQANVHPLGGWTSAMPVLIQTAIVNYLNSLQIGELVTQSAIVAAAMAVTPDLDTPAFSIHDLFIGTAASPTLENDIPIAFNAVAQGITGNVTVTQV